MSNVALNLIRKHIEKSSSLVNFDTVDYFDKNFVEGLESKLAAADESIASVKESCNLKTTEVVHYQLILSSIVKAVNEYLDNCISALVTFKLQPKYYTYIDEDSINSLTPSSTEVKTAYQTVMSMEEGFLDTVLGDVSALEGLSLKVTKQVPLPEDSFVYFRKDRSPLVNIRQKFDDTYYWNAYDTNNEPVFIKKTVEYYQDVDGNILTDIQILEQGLDVNDLTFLYQKEETVNSKLTIDSYGDLLLTTDPLYNFFNYGIRVYTVVPYKYVESSVGGVWMSSTNYTTVYKPVILLSSFHGELNHEKTFVDDRIALLQESLDAFLDKCRFVYSYIEARLNGSSGVGTDLVSSIQSLDDLELDKERTEWAAYLVRQFTRTSSLYGKPVGENFFMTADDVTNHIYRVPSDVLYENTEYPGNEAE